MVNKTCNRHTKKRKLPSFDQWDGFTNELSNWSRPLQKDVLDIKYLFDPDQLPITFGSQLEINEDGVLDRTALTKAINQLVKITWQNCGFRFRQSGFNSSQYLLYSFYCCQDTSTNSNSSAKKNKTAR